MSDALEAVEREFSAALAAGEERKVAVRAAVDKLKAGNALQVGDAPLSTGVELLRRLARIDGSLAQIPQSHLVFARRFPGEEFGDALIANAQVNGATPVRIANGRLDGEKRFCTGSAYADLLAVTADEGGEAVAVLIPADAPGVEIADDFAAMGQSYTSSGTIRFTGVDVSRAPRSLRDDALRLRHYGAYAQALHAGIDLGLFEGAVAAAYARAGRAPDQLLAGLTGEVEVELYVAGASLRIALVALDSTDADPERVATDVTAAKLAVQDAALRTVPRLFEITGTAGAMGADPLDRWWRDLRMHTLHDRRRDKLRLLGERALSGSPIPLTEKLS
ncbi:acyl-CoA dehydrogenase [Corynebacterium sanguinis]|uniref:acyl-CoA dehydrogenase family protein n=1 Tax=Corynebacterium sanguinis TaxID=2594913 RepID=UPI0021B047C7|nr:acyl-CoA dehydrogenase family protein [Corynebacterium sanguinis]MCT1556291.1 acyl-CoA dehydrogenase [Corynebacterium sanguinis]MCT1664926.1 acyl-CoA dehydrogenase [Corynebacterium sanguinis]MCT1883491.1 acyl-CoA dehydrogenase [Corynebacterium sanguinis]MDN8623158.1 acyl-CoA dehydrogenase family protein [Corynebacterium sanguinis]